MVDTRSKKSREEQEEAAEATLTLAKNNNERELIAGKVNALSLAIGIRIGIGIASGILCLHVSSSASESSSLLLFSCAFSVSFSISFSIYSALISVLILRRKLLQRPAIVYQNDKMELSSGAVAGANVFGNISRLGLLGCKSIWPLAAALDWSEDTHSLPPVWLPLLTYTLGQHICSFIYVLKA